MTDISAYALTLRDPKARVVKAADFTAVQALHKRFIVCRSKSEAVVLSPGQPKTLMLPLDREVLDAWWLLPDQPNAQRGLMGQCLVEWTVEAIAAANAYNWYARMEGVDFGIYDRQTNIGQAIDPVSPHTKDIGSPRPKGQQAVSHVTLNGLLASPNTAHEHREGASPNPFHFVAGPYLMTVRYSPGHGHAVPIAVQSRHTAEQATVRVSAAMTFVPMALDTQN